MLQRTRLLVSMLLALPGAAALGVGAGHIEDPNIVAGKLTLAALKKHYGPQLKANNYRCALPAGAQMRAPERWDCTEWVVPKVSFGVPGWQFDSLGYRALPDGTIVYREYELESDCTRALGTFLNLYSLVFPGRSVETGAAPVSDPADATGSMTVAKTYAKGGQEDTLRLSMRQGKCSLSYSSEASN